MADKTGGPDADSFRGDKADDYFRGLGGDDSLTGNGGNDRLEGGEGDDVISGGAGDDSLYGGEGNDSLHGGSGNDYLVGDSYYLDLACNDILRGDTGDDVIIDRLGTTADIDGGLGHDKITVGYALEAGVVDGGAGYDTLLSDTDDISGLTILNFEVLDAQRAVSATAEQFESFDKIIFFSNPEFTIFLSLASPGTVDLSDELGDRRLYFILSAGSDTVTTGNGPDYILGGDGDDTIDTGNGNSYVRGDSGDDRLIGGTGHDTLEGGAGDDMLNGGANIDALVDLEGTVFMDGGDGDDSIAVGSAQAGTIDGGAGTDTLRTTGDISGLSLHNMEELATEGFEVIASAAQLENFTSIFRTRTSLAADIVLTLAAAGSVDLADQLDSSAATFTGSDGNDGITTGSGDDQIYGGRGSDMLSGGDGADHLDGGQDADTLVGGAGDDVYIVDKTTDSVIELADEGIDLVRSSVSYRLSDHVENLTITGTRAVNATGNALANALTGNDAANRIDGGAGADSMAGGAGDDEYLVDDIGDSIVEVSGGGIDTVISTVSYRLGVHQDDLILSGADALKGTGNALANVITGGGGDNALNGGGGADVLTGGLGADRFIFRSALGGDNVDAIADFTIGQDMIILGRKHFDQIGPDGGLATTAFANGPATDADDRILYDAATGHLFYDSDGSGAAAAILFATLTPGLALGAADFAVIA